MTSRVAAYLRIVSVLLMLVSASTTTDAFGQTGTTQISILGVPPILPSPIVEDLFEDYDQGKYLFNIVYSSPSTRPTPFRLQAKLMHNGRSVAEILSRPIDLTPGVYSFSRLSEGPGFFFEETGGDLLDLLIDGIGSGIRETHSLPEGQYQFEATLIPENTAAAIVSIPGIVLFNVRFAQPPVLFTPSDLAKVNQPYAVFSWTPVTVPDPAMVEYDFLLVEVAEDQSPLDALLGNRAHLEVTLEGQTTLQYGPQFLPLESGTNYAWQVRARDSFGNTPITEDGYSEIRSFAFNPSASAESLRQLSEIVLEPGFAVLRNLSRMDVERTASSYILSGSGDLEFLGSSPFRMPVSFRNLEIQNVNLAQPVLLGGAVQSRRGPLKMGSTPIPDIVQIAGLQWTFGEGFTLDGNLQLPDGRQLDAEGQVRFNQAGLFGDMTATGDPIFESNDELVQVRVDQVSVNLPGGQMTGRGSATLFGETVCSLNNMRFADGEIVARAACEPSTDIAIAGKDGEFSLALERVDGRLAFGETGLTYDLTSRANIKLATFSPLTEVKEACGLRTFISLRSGEGVSTDGWLSSCTNSTPTLDLGLFNATLMRLGVDRFDYSDSEWDVSLVTDLRLTSPYLNNYTLPVIADVRINKNGIDIPQSSFDDADLRDVIPMGAFSLLFRKLDFPALRFLWFDWDKVGPGPWDFAYHAAIRFPDNATQPECLGGGELDIRGFYVEEVGLGGGVQSDDIGACRIPIGNAGTAIVTDRLTVDFGSFLNFDENAYQAFKINLKFAGEGRIEYGNPFACEAGGDDVGPFSFGPAKGGIDLRIENFVPSCGLSIGPLTASVTRSVLALEAMQGRQYAYMNGTGRIRLGDANSNNAFSEGTFGLNLITGEFTDLDFALESAFSFAVPADKPIFEFTVDRARLDTTGLFVDGNQTLRLNQSRTPVAFDKVRMDITQGEIRSGEIRFEQAFALAGGVDAESDQLVFRATEAGSNPQLEPGFVAELDGTGILDSTGFRFSGDVDGRFVFENQTYDSDLRVEFSDDFQLGTHPPNISTGRADFYYTETRLAYADASGLHPATGDILTELLPDVLPLPSADIAYLKLKDGDIDLVTFTDQGGGLTAINSIGAGPVLVVPAFDAANPPDFANVVLDNVVVRVSNNGFAYESGKIGVQLAVNGDDNGGLPDDWPVNIRNIAFEDRESNGPGLYVDGSLVLFGSDLGNDADVSLYVSAAGAFGQVSITDLDVKLPMVGESDIVSLAVSEVSGVVGAGQSNSTRLDVTTRIEIVADDEVATGADLQLRWDGAALVVTGFDFDGVGGGQVDVGPVSLQFDGIESVGGLAFSDVGGWLFDIVLDAQLVVNLEGDRQFVIPLQGLGISPSGLIIPQQDIHEGTMFGLNLPVLALAGVTLKPIGLRTLSATTIDWYSGELANIVAPGFSPAFDFELRVPSLASTGIVPIDGLTIYGASIQDGLIDATIEPFATGSALELPLIPGLPDGPLLAVSEIGGALSSGGSDNNAQRSQLISIELLSTLERLGVFENEDACAPSAPFRMQMIDGLYFQGSIATYQPCGTFAIGPASLSFGPSDISFEFTPDVEQVLLNGSATVSLPGAQANTTVSASGLISVDVLAGTLTDGSIALNDPFSFGVPLDADEPLLQFAASSALLDPSGFKVSGTGNLDAAGTTANVQFSDLLFGFPTLAVQSGSATIASGLDLQFNLSPLGWSFVSPNAPQPSDNFIRVGLNGGAVLSTTGLGFAGSATADLVFADQPFASLTTEFGNGFALNLGAFNVNQGHAHFFTADDLDEPLAILDQNGFSIGGGIVALLPAQLGLPTLDVAYLVTRDGQGNPLIDAANSGNGWSLSTNNPISLVLAGLEDGQGNAPTFDVEFQLSTDAAYNVVSGSISLASPVDLEPELGIPLTLDGLSLDASGPLSLVAELSIALPKALGEHDLSATVGITPSGFADILVELGEYATAYSEGVTPLSSFAFSSGSNNSARDLSVALHGVRIGLGATPSLNLSATLASSLLTDDDSPAFFFAGGFSGNSWSIDVDPIGLDESIPLGVASLRPLGQDPFGILLDDTRFELSVDGELSFEELFGEPFDVLIQDFVIGVRNVDTNPSIVLEVPSVTLPDQDFELFEGAVALEINAPTLGMVNGVIAVSADAGAIEFANMNVAFGALSFDTEGTFSLSDVSVGNVQILGDLVSLKSIGLGMQQGQLRLDAGFTVTLPEPIDATATATLSIFRDNQGAVQVESEMPTFDLNAEYALGEFGVFKLSKAKVDVKPFDPLSSGVYVNGVVEVDNDPVVWFGSDGNFPNEAGISYTDLTGLRYNVTGNVNFELETSFFEIAVEANGATSSSNAFALELGGQASVTIAGVGGSVGYEGFTVGADGVTDVGSLVAPAEFTLLEIMTLSVGNFEYTSSANGVSIEIADGFGQGMEEVQNRAGQAPPTKQVTVKEYLCFGRCGSAGSDVSLTIGGGGSNDNGAFSGGVDEVLFYKTLDGSTYLHVDNFHLQLGNTFEMSASLQYENSSEGLTLRAVGGGAFDIGGVQAQASLAGSFSTVGNKPSFGLFVAVSSNVGIPIVPGVVDLTGAGGGFFLNPRQADLNLVTGPSGALAAFGYETIKPVPVAGDVAFAAMLFARAGIGGSGGKYIVDGKAFLMVTDRSVLLDAQGSVLQFDGSGSLGAELTAGLSIYASRAPFMLDGNVVVDANIPIYASGGMDLNLFMLDGEDGLVWGIIGDAELRLINNMFTATGSFAAANIGFLLEAGISFDFDIPIISIDVDASGSIWLMTDEQFPLPFGAYATVFAELCVDLLLGDACASAELRAAIVKRRPSGFEMFAAIAAEIPLVPGKARAWASVSQDGVRFGLGGGGKNDLIAEAQKQAQDFKDYVASLADEIDAARGAMENQTVALEDLVVSSQDAAAAGAKFYTLNKPTRDSYAQQIESNEPNVSGQFADYNFVRDSLLLGDLPGARPLQGDPRFDAVFVAQGKAQALEGRATEVANLVAPRLRQAELEAIVFRADADAVLDEFYASLEDSPVVAFDQGHSGPDAEAPTIEVDLATVTSLAAQSETLAESVASSAEETLEAINTISENLSRIHSLMSLQFTFEIRYDPITGNMASGSLSSEPSVNDMMQAFSAAETAFDEYYAEYGNWYWSGRAWAQRMNNKLYTSNGAVKSGLVQYFNAAYSTQGTKTARLATSVERARLLSTLAGSAAAEAAYQAHPKDPALITDVVLKELYTTNGIRLWYDFHTGGTTALGEVLASAAMKALEGQRLRVRPLIQAHAAATTTMERVYQLRADISAMQYSLVDNLLSQNSTLSFLPDSVETRMIGLKRYLGNALQVPDISGISVTSTRQGYVNRSNLGLSVQHPLNVSEVSVQFERNGGTATDTELYDYRSIGYAADVPFITGRSGYSRGGGNESVHESKQYSVGIRARGPAGNSAIRRAQFTVAVGPQGSSTGGGSDDDILVVDSTPPEHTQITFELDYGSSTIALLVPRVGGGFEFADVTRYWSDDSNKIDMLVSARDLESDIAKFEYSVGTTSGGTDIIDWADLQGTRFTDLGSDGRPAVYVDAATRLFTLDPGRGYYVSVRATNGDGLVGATITRGAVIHDPTPPTNPSPIFVAATFPIPLYFPPPVYSPVTSVPAYTHPGPQTYEFLASQIQGTAYPKVAVRWNPSQDPESGVAGYEYVRERGQSEPNFNGGDTVTEPEKVWTSVGQKTWNTFLIAQYAGFPHNYVDPVQLHVRAKNNALATSESLLVGGTPIDPTGPTGFDARVRVRPGALDLFLTKAVYDFESGMAGIEYSIGRTPGAVDIRNWPSDVDFLWNNAQSFSHHDAAAPAFTVATSTLPQGTFYINMRARNTKGSRGATVVAGPIVLDSSPPLAPSVTLSKSGDNLRIVANGMQDPESGLSKIEYKVDNKFDIFKTSGWKTFRYVSGNPTTAMSHTRIENVSAITSLNGAKVSIRLTNALGLQTVVTRSMPLYYSF